MTKILRKFLLILLAALLLFNLWILISGKTFVYKALIYNYVGIDDLDLFSHRTVKSGVPQAWPVKADIAKPLPAYLKAELEKQESVAFVVIHRDSLLHESYWSGYGDSSLTNSFSMSKSFIGALVGVALKEGLIRDLNQSIADFIPEFKNDKRSAIRIRDLLSMSAALSWDESYASLFSETTEGYYGTDLDGQMLRQSMRGEPGKDYYYQGAATQILAMMLTRVSGMSVSEYMSEKIWTKVGAENHAEWSLDREGGMEKASCCFYSNARDFARFGSLYLHMGNWRGTQIIDSAYVAESIRPAPLNDEGKPNRVYGFQWWIDELEGEKIFYCRGILGQYIVVIPSKDCVFVRLGHKRGQKEDGTLTDLPVYVKGVLEMLSNQ